MYDLCIRNARIIDGTGIPAFVGDIGIVGERIVALGSQLVAEAHQVFDAGGQVVALGFIDAHTHDDLVALREGIVPMKVQQGITSVITGNCGFSLAPLTPMYVDAMKNYSAPVLGEDAHPWTWYTTEALFDRLRGVALGQHIRPLIGHGPVRVAVMGFDQRDATEQEMRTQEGLVRDAMEAGAAGMSLGLMYAPGMYTPTTELLRLASVVGRYGGVVTSHMRGEGDQLLQSLTEMLTIAEHAEVAVHISHLKVTGRKNWGSIQQALDRIADARASGLNVTMDVYPYTAGSTMSTQLLPPWLQEGGLATMLQRLREPETQCKVRRDFVYGIDGWENQVGANGWDRVVVSAVHQEHLQVFEGKNLLEVAEALCMAPEEAFFHLILEEQGQMTILIFHMDEHDVDQVVQAPFSMIGSDGLPLRSGRPHPRLYGTFPRFFKRYVRETGSLTVEEAVHKVTALPAERFRLADRGVIAIGNSADLVIFNPATINDLATYEQPRMYPEGISMVVVAGQIVVRDKQLTPSRPGQLIAPSHLEANAVE